MRTEPGVWTAGALQLGRGNLKQFGIYLFFLVNIFWVNLLGIPVGTQRDLDSDGRCFLSTFLCGSYQIGTGKYPTQ